MPNSSNRPESSYPALELPEFKSQIPPYLLEGVSAADKYLMESQSRMEQYFSWSTKAHVSTMKSVRETNGRLLKAEADLAEIQQDKRILIGGWKMIVAAVGGVAGVISCLYAIYRALNSGS